MVWYISKLHLSPPPSPLPPPSLPPTQSSSWLRTRSKLLITLERGRDTKNSCKKTTRHQTYIILCTILVPILYNYNFTAVLRVYNKLYSPTGCSWVRLATACTTPATPPPRSPLPSPRCLPQYTRSSDVRGPHHPLPSPPLPSPPPPVTRSFELHTAPTPLPFCITTCTLSHTQRQYFRVCT